MNIQNLLKAFLIVALIISPTASATDPSELPWTFTQEGDVTFIDPPFEGHYYATYERVASTINMNYMPSIDGTDQIHLLVLDYRNATMAISIIRDLSKWGTNSRFFSFYIKDHDADLNSREVDGVTINERKSTNYMTEISDEEFETIAQSFSSSRFFNEDFSDKHGAMCVLGDYYFIDMEIDGRSNFVGGHVCEKGFPVSDQAVEKLIELARKHFPMVANQISTMQTTLQQELVQPD